MTYATLIEQRIYVACLASYNAGILHGAWISCNQDAETIKEEIAAMLKSSTQEGAEEWAIHDHEGFCGYPVEEWHDIEELAEVVEILNCGDYDPALIVDVNNNFYGQNLKEALEYLQDNYAGCYLSYSWQDEFAESLCVLDEIPERLQYYFDTEKYVNDMELSGDIFTITIDSLTHVIWNR